MSAADNYLVEQCQKQGLVYVPSAGVFDADGTALFMVSSMPESGGVDLSHPRFADMDGWHSLYVMSSEETLIYSNPDPNAYNPDSVKLYTVQDLPDLRGLSRLAGAAG